MIKKSGFKFFIQKLVFQSLFDSKHLRNRDKPINYLKKQKKPSQKSKSNQNKKSIRAQIYFLTNFKGKKTPNMNFSHQIK